MRIKMQSPFKYFLEPIDPPGGGDNNPPAGGDNNPAPTGSGDDNNPSGNTGVQPQNKGQKSVFDVPGSGDNNPTVPGTNDANPAPVVPESYEFNLGEGLTITDELKGKFTEIAKGAKLTQEQANALIDMHSSILLDYMHQTEAKVNGWVDECQKAGYLSEENLGYAKSAINYFGGSDAMNALVETGAINHPAVFKMVMTIGQLIAEDAPPKGDPPKGPKSSADILFPNSKYD